MIIIICALACAIYFVSLSYAQELPSFNESKQLQSEIMQLKQNISHLESINRSNVTVDYGNELLKQGIALIGIGGAAGFAAFFAWRRERMIPPTVDQERILNEIATEWYSRSHLDSYNEQWKKIENAKGEEQESIVENVWDKLCVKEFPRELYNSDKVENKISEYIKRRLHMKTEDLYERIKVIMDASSVEYYDNVRKYLPEVAEIAVLATIGQENVMEQGYEKVVEESLKKLKRLMVFYRLREDKKVVEIVLRSVVSKKIPT